MLKVNPGDGLFRKHKNQLKKLDLLLAQLGAETSTIGRVMGLGENPKPLQNLQGVPCINGSNCSKASSYVT